MSAIIPLAAVEPVLFGVVKLRWSDGFEAIADLRPVFAAGDILEFLQIAPARFWDVKMSEHGHEIYWLDDVGDEIELGSDSLRQRAVRQAELLRLAS